MNIKSSRNKTLWRCDCGRLYRSERKRDECHGWTTKHPDDIPKINPRKIKF